MQSRSRETGTFPLHEMLAEALAGNPTVAGFDVHYQPIARFEDNAIVAVEALPHWHHPRAGRIDARHFIAVAERMGLAGVLDDFVLNRACSDAGTLAALYGEEVAVHVNVANSRLGRPDLEAAIAWVLNRHKLAPGRLTIEIAEAATLDDGATAAAAMQRLRDRGVQVALDHFGSGLVGLTQLQTLPVDIVKLDMTMTNADADFWRTEDVCQSVVNVCRKIGASVVAESIDTPSQARVLHTMGCHMGQGRLYGAAAGLQ